MIKFTIQDCVNINRVIGIIENICANSPCKNCPLHNRLCGPLDVVAVLHTLYDIAISDATNETKVL